MKDLKFVIPALREEMRTWPESARVDAGRQLDKVQKGQEPDDYKPFPEIAKGVYEIRTQDEDKKQHRVFYVAKFREAVWVLHVITGKTTRKTTKRDVDLARGRYKSLIDYRREKGLDRKPRET